MLHRCFAGKAAKTILECGGALYNLLTAPVMVVPGLKKSLESSELSYSKKVSRKKKNYSNRIDPGQACPVEKVGHFIHLVRNGWL